MKCKAEENDHQTTEVQNNVENTTEEPERPIPWTEREKKLKKPPAATENAALESFISCLERTIINLKNLKKVKDNLTFTGQKSYEKSQKLGE